MMMIIITCVGTSCMEKASANAVEPNGPLDGARRVYASSEHERREQSLSTA